ncbi:uncharacterized protein SPPG_05036 [Spizellomyces punctatus DAOM BR117]|uniref:Ceramidase n=1 Tax=Spizellomyces punctatus (strain DAOM BR117) TaxID=645134 RepID=A0A0L0HDX9_SPIPD|nr:uncharacterized protein SPPG_05036 [Spizellomyces punctatus DAOM BR117]KNC99655.1 hypothetical protein SPPG_05036 [Spizellomyces punctatus DAOM BR117]|eukprot:XP_016607695.1 hypothetical protein SPPG_05036 [Spizellomyces punctatus DAOM BR117]
MSSSHGFNLTSLLKITSNYTVSHGLDGYWGPVTSTLDWCEENYIVSPYLAEYWNSTTNLVFLVWPLIGLYSCWKTGAEKRFWASFAALMCVGTGSFLFHGTLRYAMQLLDELPMAMGTCVFVYCHLQMFSKKLSPSIILGLFLTFLLTCTAYLVIQTPILFQAAFATLTLLQLFIGLYNLYKISKVNPKAGRTLGRMTAVCVASMLTAFVLWNTDQLHCGTIQEHRNRLGYPFRVGLELHAWWHLLTGYSGYTSVVASQYGRALALGREDVSLTWPAPAPAAEPFDAPLTRPTEIPFKPDVPFPPSLCPPAHLPTTSHQPAQHYASLTWGKEMSSSGYPTHAANQTVPVPVQLHVPYPQPFITAPAADVVGPSAAVSPMPVSAPVAQGWTAESSTGYTSTKKARRSSRPQLSSVHWQGPPAPATCMQQQTQSISNHQHNIDFSRRYSMGSTAPTSPPPMSQGAPVPFRKDSLQPQHPPSYSAQPQQPPMQRRYTYHLGDDDVPLRPQGIAGWASSIMNRVDSVGNKIVDALGFGAPMSTAPWDMRHKYDQAPLTHVGVARPSGEKGASPVKHAALHQSYDPSALV